MTRQFKVVVTRKMEQIGTVMVEARDEEEAADRASLMPERGIDWEDDKSRGGFDVDHVEVAS